MVIPLAIIQLVCSASQIRFPASNQQSVFIAALILKDRRCLVNTASKGMKTKPSSETASKILRSVSCTEGFHFFLDTGIYLGESAVSLLTFSLTLEKIELILLTKRCNTLGIAVESVRYRYLISCFLHNGQHLF